MPQSPESIMAWMHGLQNAGKQDSALCHVITRHVPCITTQATSLALYSYFLGLSARGQVALSCAVAHRSSP